MPTLPPKSVLTAIKEAPELLKAIPTAQENSLGALIAYRQQAQLAEAAKHLNVNPETFIGAYLGDQRSIPSALRALQEQENLKAGLPPNPGRRKVLKQAASTAIQSQLPGGSVVKRLLSTSPDPTSLATTPSEVLSSYVPGTPVTIPHIQAAISHMLDRVLGHPSVLNQLTETGEFLYNASPEVKALHQSLTTEGISQATGIPARAIHQHFKKSKINAQQLAEEWVNVRNGLEAFQDSTLKHKFFDYGFDDIPYSKEDPLAKRVIENLSNADDENLQPIDDFYKLYETLHRRQLLEPYKKLLGPHSEMLMEKHEGAFGHPEQAIDEMLGDVMDSDYIGDLMERLRLEK